ncbi:hypothetical protein CPB84DRAFT_331956 [Gymnopilus junonius]|uniref:Uncharacterized protein n=1 Tax=Gymnopilus junonius TaxID=109634 RepID=A0A9P5TGJ4_GYMJU|nr:hypothetical protein CPB84DRAFT_331956 [Gymnopilus junonius]
MPASQAEAQPIYFCSCQMIVGYADVTDINQESWALSHTTTTTIMSILHHHEILLILLASLFTSSNAQMFRHRTTPVGRIIGGCIVDVGGSIPSARRCTPRLSGLGGRSGAVPTPTTILRMEVKMFLREAMGTNRIMETTTTTTMKVGTSKDHTITPLLHHLRIRLGAMVPMHHRDKITMLRLYRLLLLTRKRSNFLWNVLRLDHIRIPVLYFFVFSDIVAVVYYIITDTDTSLVKKNCT